MGGGTCNPVVGFGLEVLAKAYEALLGLNCFLLLLRGQVEAKFGGVNLFC